MRIELWPIDRPRPYAKNPRRITEKAIEKVASSIREFGFRQPLVVDPKGVLIAGHTRLLGAKKLGLSKVPVTIADDLSPAQIKAYRIADNRSAQESSWDDDVLADELADLDAMGWDLGLTGFDPIEISALRDPGQDPRETLADRFLIAPFSVLSAREGWWQARKAAWIALGIESELGRGGNLLKMSDTILDPDGRLGRNPRARAAYAPIIIRAQSLTPCELHGDLWFKRDDLFRHAGAIGGKARSALAIAAEAPAPLGLITAGSRASPQIEIVSKIALSLGIPCRAHCPQGALSPGIKAAQAAGAEIIQHPAGYNNVIIARAKDDARQHPGWREIPFGMEHPIAVAQTAAQCANLPKEAKRILVPCGSGMSLAGILWGLRHFKLGIPVAAVICGADPAKRLAKWGPPGAEIEWIKPPEDYHDAVQAAAEGVALDPYYEAKCARFIRPGDCFWIVGIREMGSGDS